MIDGLIGLPPSQFGAAIVTAAREASQGEEAVLIVEHITSRCGVTLPIQSISKALHATDSRIRLVVDGAQAVGIQPVPNGFSDCYIGCFHKYVDGPSACGFAVVPRLCASALSYYLAARLWTSPGDTAGEEDLPTDDRHKWAACEDALLKLERCRNEASARERVMSLRRVLDEVIKPIATIPPLPADSAYRSHIAAFDCASPAQASFIHGELRRLGYSVKADARWLRVSLHHTVDASTVRSFARELRRLLLAT